MIKRPATSHGSVATTKTAATMIELLGGYRREGNAFTNEEIKALEKYYKLDKPTDNPLDQAGKMLSLFRLIDKDGMRVMAYLAKYLEEENEDPIKFLQSILVDAGLDVTDLEEEDCSILGE